MVMVLWSRLIQRHPEEVLNVSKGKSHTLFPFSDVSHHKPLTFLSSLSCTHSPLSTSSHSISKCAFLYVCVCVCSDKTIQCPSHSVELGWSQLRWRLFISMNLTALDALLLACFPVCVSHVAAIKPIKPRAASRRFQPHIHVSIRKTNQATIRRMCCT